MKNPALKWALSLACAACLPLSSQALTIGSLERIATLDLATAVQTGVGNPQASDIASEFASAQPWTLRGNVATGAITDGLLTVNLTGGSWGSGSAAGTWTLASSFWNTYESAVLAIHVGDGGGNPDHFSFLLAPGTMTGTWSYDKISVSGGGLSNLRLFTSGTPSLPNDPPNTVPDGGSSAVLLGLAAGCIALLRRTLMA